MLSEFRRFILWNPELCSFSPTPKGLGSIISSDNSIFFYSFYGILFYSSAFVSSLSDTLREIFCSITCKRLNTVQQIKAINLTYPSRDLKSWSVHLVYFHFRRCIWIGIGSLLSSRFWICMSLKEWFLLNWLWQKIGCNLWILRPLLLELP